MKHYLVLMSRQKRSVMVLDVLVTEIPSTVKAASLADTTVAVSPKLPVFCGSYFITFTADPESDVVTRIALANPSGDFNISE